MNFHIATPCCWWSHKSSYCKGSVIFGIFSVILIYLPAGKHVFEVNNRGTRDETCSEITIKTPERRQWRRSVVFIVNFEHISLLVLVFLLWTLRRQMPARMATVFSLTTLLHLSSFFFFHATLACDEKSVKVFIISVTFYALF